MHCEGCAGLKSCGAPDFANELGGGQIATAGQSQKTRGNPPGPGQDLVLEGVDPEFMERMLAA